MFSSTPRYRLIHLVGFNRPKKIGENLYTFPAGKLGFMPDQIPFFLKRTPFLPRCKYMHKPRYALYQVPLHPLNDQHSLF